MEHAESYRWFKNVRWVENDYLIDCLVDTSVSDLEGSHFLLTELDGFLEIYSSSQLKTSLRRQEFKILGKALKRALKF